MSKDQTYVEQHKGSLRRYQITKPGAKHSRQERIDGRLEFVVYGTPNVNNPDFRNVIELHPSDYEKFKHLGLLELGREQVIIVPKGTEAGAAKARDAAKAAAKEAVEKAEKERADAAARAGQQG